MNEQELYGLFGVEEPAPTGEDGAKEQEVADPVDGEGEPATDDGAKEQEPADPAEDTPPAEDTGDDTPPVEEPPVEQTRQERARFAAARRRAETDAAVKAAVEEAKAAMKAEYDRLLGAVGIPNPYKNGETIRSVEDLTAFQQEYDRRNATERLGKGGVTPEDIQRIVAEMPEVKAAAAAMEKAKAAEEAAAQAAFEAEVKEQLAAIHALDPTVQTLEDILAMDNAAEFAAAVKDHHMNYLDAFRFVNMDRLAAARQENARREALYQQRGKEHMKPVTARGAGEVSVPVAEMALYRQLMPEATDAEIQRHYNKYLKK